MYVDLIFHREPHRFKVYSCDSTTTSKSKLFDTAQFAKDIEQQYLNVWLNFIK
jgi:hypothetical protein